MLKLLQIFLFLGNCGIAGGAFIYAISGNTFLHIMWGGVAGINIGAALFILKER